MPFIPFFSDTLDTTPRFNETWRRYRNSTKHTKIDCRNAYYKQVRDNRTMAGESTIEETEMRTLGYTSEPSEEFVKRIYGDDYITSRKPKLRYDKNRTLADDDLTNRIDKIRNQAPPQRNPKRSKPYLDQEARRRNLSDDKNYDGGSGSSIGITMIMAFVGLAVMLLVGIMIFGAVSNNVVDTNSPHFNSTMQLITECTWTSGENGGSEICRQVQRPIQDPFYAFNDPLEMLLAPFYQLKDKLGELVGLDDFPMWALLPLIIGVMMVVIKTFGVLTVREE